MATEAPERPGAVVAECSHCGDRHPLGARSVAGPTTTCPHCGAASYSSEIVAADLDAEADRIRDLVGDVEGVGPDSLAALIDRFLTVEALRRARPDELREVPNVGDKTARNILDELEP